VEWVIDAHGCPVERLQDLARLQELFQALVREFNLKPVGDPVWHQFPGTQGVTGVLLLQESHLTLHTFPEHRSACLNLFCCRERKAIDWGPFLTFWLGAGEIQLQECRRHYVHS
jgi:S-adenosylmethionine decarboxylase